LDEKYGVEGTPERIAFEEKAYAYYTGQILEDARKKAHLTQSELAERIGSDKSYISRIEKGKTEPKDFHILPYSQCIGTVGRIESSRN